MNEQQLKLGVSVTELNLILNGLAQLPYIQSATTIHRLQAMASEQLQPQTADNAA